MVNKLVDIRVGVLSLQGAFKEHIVKLKKCRVKTLEIRFPGQLAQVDGVIIPGGESTTINKLLKEYNFNEALDKFYKKGKPIFGTCAGLILIAKEIQGEGKGLGYIDINVKRNAYGRQIDSFEEMIYINFDSVKKEERRFRSVFIRAPGILSTGRNVKIMAEFDGKAILVKDGNVMASTFHPELTDDTGLHRYFVNMIKKYKEGI